MGRARAGGWILGLALLLPSSTWAQKAATAKRPIDTAVVKPLAAATPSAAVIRLKPSVAAPKPAASAAPADPAAAPTVELKQQPASAFVLKEGGDAARIDVSKPALTLKQGELLVTRSSESAVTNSATTKTLGTRVEAPYEVHFLGEGGVMRTSRVIAEIAGGGLRVKPQSEAFSTELYVALQDEANPAASYELPQPAALLVTADVDQVEPADFRIARTGQWQRIDLRTASPKEPIAARIRASTLPDAIEIKLPVIRPRLLLQVHPATILGFGLETATISVRSEGLPSPAGRVVVLDAQRGRLEATTVKLDAEGTASTVLRSAGSGVVSIRAASPPLSPARLTGIYFQVPTRFAAWAVFGGALGGLIRLGMELQRDKSSRRRKLWQRVLVHAGFGAAVGFCCAVLAALGVEVIGVSMPASTAEAAVGATALLGALFGAERLLKLREAEPPAKPT
jgi:hypothetical protein